MSKRVLVVDDAMFMRKVLGDMLVSNGYEVVAEAGDGLEAIEAYKKNSPDIVTMDITMPKMDGIEAVREIKKIDPKAKIVMSSAMGQQSMVLEAIKAGASDFLVKPFNEDRVIKAIANLSN